MGDRGQIVMVHKVGDFLQAICLYSHWDGESLLPIVRELESASRWGDQSYLTRIVFSRMVRSHIELETGFGIGHSVQHDLQHDVPVIEAYNSRPNAWLIPRGVAAGTFNGMPYDRMDYPVWRDWLPIYKSMEEWVNEDAHSS